LVSLWRTAQRGTRIVLADPRITDIGRHTWRNLQFKAGTDVALLNAMLHVIVHEGLCNEAFLKERADNVAELKVHVRDYTPEAMSAICGISADTIRSPARLAAPALACTPCVAKTTCKAPATRA
jgi:formate dehydrogenase major subunit